MKKYVLHIDNNDQSIYRIGYLSDKGIIDIEKHNDSNKAIYRLNLYSLIGNHDELSETIYDSIYQFTVTNELYKFLLSLFVKFHRSNEPQFNNLLNLLDKFEIPYKINNKDFVFPDEMFTVENIKTTYIVLFFTLYKLYLLCDKLTNEEKYKYFIDICIMLFYNTTPCWFGYYNDPQTMKYTIDNITNIDDFKRLIEIKKYE